MLQGVRCRCQSVRNSCSCIALCMPATRAISYTVLMAWDTDRYLVKICFLLCKCSSSSTQFWYSYGLMCQRFQFETGYKYGIQKRWNGCVFSNRTMQTFAYKYLFLQYDCSRQSQLFFFFATTAAPCTGQPLQRLMDSYFKEMRWHICQVNILAQLNLWCYEITWGPLKLALLSLEINPALTFANKRSVFSLNPFFLQLPQKIKSDSYSQGNPILQSLHICRCISMLQTHKLHQNAWCDKSQCTHIRGNIIQKSWLAQ